MADGDRLIASTKAKQRKVLSEIAWSLRRKVGHLVPAEISSLEDVIGQMHNRTASSRARSTSVPITPAVEAQIRWLRRADPAMPQHEIATRVGTNQGRVNETLIGKRE